MKIGFYVADVSIPTGYDDAASAHVKIPLHCLKLLRDAGHTVDLITTEFMQGERLPRFIPVDVAVHQVVNPRRRKLNGAPRMRPLGLIAHLWQIGRVIARERYDVVHFHGFGNTPDLAALVELLGAKVPFVATVNDLDLPLPFWFARRHLWKRMSAVVTSTEFVQDRLRTCGVRADVIRHGAVRDIAAECTARAAAQPQHRVVFWRDPSFANGIDVCLAAFRELAPRFPRINFDVAVRKHREDWMSELKALAAAHPNIGVHVFPYAAGTTLAQLLGESICVLLPFRTLSYHPQLSVLESIQLGRAVVTTAQGSNAELADGGRRAMLVPAGDVSATVAAIETLVRDPAKANEFAKQAAQSVRAAWNWDNYVVQMEHTYRRAIGQG
jgi:glycosyltransferase involved in cell wall biosynthesis